MLLEKLDEGYDAVFGLRANRQDKLLHPQAAEPGWATG